MATVLSDKPTTGQGLASRFSTADVFGVDIEQKAIDEAHLQNTTVQNFTWQGVTVTVKDRKTKAPKVILDGIDGSVNAGK